VQLPRTFYMGFEEFASSLPSTAAAPLLGQQLSQTATLLNILIDGRVDSITELKRTKLREEGGAAAATPGASPAKKGAAPSAAQVFQRNVVDLTFVAGQPAARKVLNQIASSSQQFYLIRTLYVRNEKEKGPPREGAEASSAAATPPSGFAVPRPSPAGTLKFIVGNEHVQTSIRVEMLRFTF
jgi:hypothetical protein